MSHHSMSWQDIVLTELICDYKMEETQAEKGSCPAGLPGIYD